jgi:hypothetical protein
MESKPKKRHIRKTKEPIKYASPKQADQRPSPEMGHYIASLFSKEIGTVYNPETCALIKGTPSKSL